MKKPAMIALMSLGLVACGTTTVVKEVPRTSDTVYSAPVQTQPVNKYEEYVTFVQGNSGQANSYSYSELIEVGDLVCNALDAGNEMSQVSRVLQNTAQTQSDIELYAAVMFGAVKYICPEYMNELTAYLSNL